MTFKLFFQALTKFVLGVVVVGALLFVHAGTFDYPQAWRLIGLLFTPMIIAGIWLMCNQPELLRRRLNAKEEQHEQKWVVALSGVLFVAMFVVAGLGRRFGWYMLPDYDWITYPVIALFLTGYGLYFQVLRENIWLSRTIGVQQGQKVISTGLYGKVRHPMYAATLLLFLSMPLMLGSPWAFAVMLLYVPVIALRIRNEEQVLERDLKGYKEYKQQVRYKVIPYIYMNFQLSGNKEAPTLLLIPGLGVSYEIFLPLIRLTEDKFRIIAAEVDGFTLGKHTRFTSVEDQAAQVIAYIKDRFDGHLDCAYGLSLGGKILSRILERNEITIDHAILDAAPLLPLPRWLVNPLRYYQAANVWTCYHWTGFWKAVFRSHYFDVLLDECKKTWPWGGRQAVLDGYKSVYTNKLESISGADIHFWYGTKEAFVAKPQVKHLLSLCPQAHIEVFHGMNHGQLLIDHPKEIAQRIMCIMA